MVFKRKVQIMVAILCFVLSFAITVQYKSVIKNRSLSLSEMARTNELQNQLINAKQKVIDLEKENMQLSTDLETYRSEAAQSSSGSAAMRRELDSARALAGLSTLEGTGVSVKLSDSKQKAPENADTSAYIIHDSDLRSIVNELCTAGAEAVSINNERIISTSSIRCVGNTILVNNKRCAAPFIIKAIGDSDALESGLNMREGIIDVLKLYKIDVNVTKLSKVRIEKYTGSANFEHAETVKE